MNMRIEGIVVSGNGIIVADSKKESVAPVAGV